MNQHHLLVPLLLTASACTTVGVPIPVMRAAEINLRGKSQIIVEAGAGGPATSEVVALLRQTISEAPTMKVIDRSHYGRVNIELNDSGNMSPEALARLGQVVPAAVLVVARVARANVRDDVARVRRKCTKYDQNNKPYPSECMWNTRSASVDVVANFDVIDIATSENLRPKRLPCKGARETVAVDEEPEPIDTRAMLDSCLADVTKVFARSIAPWQETVEVPFKDDSDLPLLAVGIAKAKSGDLPGAIEVFREAIRAAEANATLSAEVRAMAHGNLGAALAYSHHFAEARSALETASRLDPAEDDYLRLKSEVASLEKNHRQLQAQIGPGGAEELR